jgi:hypothetical protein
MDIHNNSKAKLVKLQYLRVRVPVFGHPGVTGQQLVVPLHIQERHGTADLMIE